MAESHFSRLLSSDMLKIYDDRTDDAQLEKYFGADGIKQIEKKGLSDL